jgi:hypothetical protein
MPPLEARVACRRWDVADDPSRLHVVHVRHRRPELGREERHHPGVFGWCDADDCVRLAVDPDRLADCARTRRVLAIPEAVRNHRRPRRTRLVVVGQQQASGFRLHAEHLKVVAGDRFVARLTGL